MHGCNRLLRWWQRCEKCQRQTETVSKTEIKYQNVLEGAQRMSLAARSVLEMLNANRKQSKGQLLEGSR